MREFAEDGKCEVPPAANPVSYTDHRDRMARPLPEMAVANRARQLDLQFLPWEFFGKLDPDEREGLYLYLHNRRPLQSQNP